jgi:hypothetical protein
MLDQVERRTLRVQPARENPVPFSAGPLDVELDESAGQPLGLPRRGRIAGAQADHQILGAHRLTRLHREIADDPVALVEKSDDRHPLGHRSHSGGGSGGAGNIGGGAARRLGRARIAVAARRDQAHSGKPEEPPLVHAWSGVHAL